MNRRWRTDDLMQIICWNTQHKRASWRFLHERHCDADAALLQEACTPPREISSNWMSAPARGYTRDGAGPALW